MIGNLRTRISVFIPQYLPDDFGGMQTSWVLSQKLWAHISPKTLSQTNENGRLVVIRSYLVTIRWQRDFPERARIVWGERVLRVLSASDPDTRHERLHLICEEEEQ